MKIIKYCNIEGGNFGDDINLQLWDRLFPDLEKLVGRVHLYGVGTLLDGRHNAQQRKVVLGTGIGEKNAAIADSNWDFRWVRGPLTASEFNLPKELAIGDSAILWPELTPAHTLDGPTGFIPHYATWDSYDWQQVAQASGMRAINPRQAPHLVIAQIRACSKVLAESLHGAICADTMGIPWAPCVLAHRFNDFKWRDWMATIDRPFAPLILDRPLVREIRATKAVANRLARLVRYKQYTRRPALRPVAISGTKDVEAVIRTLQQFSRADANFTCSSQVLIDQQRARMRAHCLKFATQYGLLFKPH